jgi:replicative DNA helicase Mcm
MTDPLSEQDRTGDWSRFLKTSYKKEMGIIAREYPHERSLIIRYADIEKWGTTGIALADELIENPGKVIEDIKEAIKGNALMRTANNKEIKDINIRFTGISKKRLLRDLRYEDVNTFVAIEGALVHRAYEVQPRIIESVHKCPAGHFTAKHQGSHVTFIDPDGCNTDGCNFKKLVLIPKRSKFCDQQRLKIQDNGEGLKLGQQPMIIEGVIFDDMCDQIYASERATFNAIVRSTQRVMRGEKSTIFDLHLEILSIEHGERDYEEIRYEEEDIDKIKELVKSGNPLEIISRSIAPSIWGNHEIKKALALQMFGGVTKILNDDQRIRGEIQIILLGDYGTSKTQLAKYVYSHSPRAVFINGPTASGPGLVGVTKQDPEEKGRWYVEPGALPLADLGVAIVDECDKMSSESWDTVYETMEDGVCRINKAANRVMNARDSMIFLGNPKFQKFDPFGDIIDQITIPPAIVNRADLLFIIIDKKDHDAEISKHILKSNYYGECKAAGKEDKLTEEQKAGILPEITPKLLKQWIAYAKNTVHPIMNAAAMARIDTYYLKLRNDTFDTSKAPVTPRQEQAVVRLSEASAKLRLSNEVTLKDVDAAIEIFDYCIRAVASDKSGNIDMGKLGQGVSSTKARMIDIITKAVHDEPGIRLNLLLAKLDEQGFKNEGEIRAVLKKMMETPAAIYEPKFESYRLV